MGLKGSRVGDRLKLYFMRHGESTANVEGVFSNRGWKHPLTVTGVYQASRAAENLAVLDFTRIYSSPVQRAVQTAEILAEVLGVPLKIAPALREWDVGIYEGTSDPTGWKLHGEVQESWFLKKDFDQRMPGGESYNDIWNRFVPFIAGLIADSEKNPGDNLLVAHGGLYLAVLPALFKNIENKFSQEHGFTYAGYAVAEVRTDGVYCISWCGIPIGG